jgi:hypothetical protein
MNRTAFATLVGLILGFAFVVTDFGDMLIVALFGLIGYGIAKVLVGDVDVAELISRTRSPR